MDKYVSILLLFIGIVCHTASALLCYHCKGPKCDSEFPNLLQVNCTIQAQEFFLAQKLPVENVPYTCVTIHGKYNNEAYTDRSCTPESISCKHLTKLLKDNQEEVLNCKTCTTDLCNGLDVIPPAPKSEETSKGGALRIEDGFALVLSAIMAIVVANHH